MSHHLGSHLHKRRSDSQTELSRYENIQKLADQDTFMKIEPRYIQERESVLSGSKINKYLNDSFEDGNTSNYRSNQDRVIAYNQNSKEKSHERESQNKILSHKRQMLRSSPGEDVIVEDIDSEEEKMSDEKQNLSSQKKQMSSKQSELTFKADEIFNDKSEQDSNTKKIEENKASLNKIKEKQNPNLKNMIDLTDQKRKDQNIWSNTQQDSNTITREAYSKSMKMVNSQKENLQQPVQLGPIGGGTLDEESSEGEEYESEISVERNDYLKGHIVQKIRELKEDKVEVENIDDDWDYEEESDKKESNKMYNYYNPGKPRKEGNKDKVMEDLNINDLIPEDF